MLMLRLDHAGAARRRGSGTQRASRAVNRRNDELDAVRGICLGLILGAALWGLIILTVLAMVTG